MKTTIKLSLLLSLLVALSSCKSEPKSVKKANDSGYEMVGNVEIIAPEFNRFFDNDAQAQILAEGFEWSEGPVWVDKYQMLLFSDVPKNKIYKWTADEGIETFLDQSGYTGSKTRGGEMGSNGLAIRKYDELIICQHGNKHVSILAAPLTDPKPKFIPIAERFGKIPFNSPNDLHIDSTGAMYFTDPPYGLEEGTKKVNPFNGIYKHYPTGRIELVYSKMTRPNGIISIPSEKAIIVSNSDPNDAKWYKIGYDQYDRAVTKDVYYDATDALKTEEGLPDGMAMHRNNYLFATGPGGVWIFNPAGTLIGKIKTKHLTSNCAFDKEYKNLYMTADDKLLRIPLKA